MKSFVLLLVRTVGTPEKKIEKEKIETEIIEKAKKYIDRGYKKGWKKWLAQESNITYPKLLYLLRKNGLESYTYMRDKEKKK